MGAEFEIKKQILIDLLKSDNDLFVMPKDDKLEEFYAGAEDTEWGDYIYDQLDEFRSSGENIDIPTGQCSSHYECSQVARQLDNGQSVSWTYWYGGGKHGEPEAIDWMDEAYFVECKQETKVVNIYSKIEVRKAA